MLRRKRIIYNVDDKHFAVMLSLACAIIYSSSYVGRLNLSSALPHMLEEGAITKTQGGILASGYFWAYGIGQLINGKRTDSTQPEKWIIIGISGAAVSNIMVSLTGSYYLMTAAWILNGFFQSMLWAPCYSLLVTSLKVKDADKYVMILNMAPAIGAVAAYLVFGGLLYYFSWRSLFYSAFLIMILAGTIFLVLSGKVHTGCEAEYSDDETPGLYGKNRHKTSSGGIRLGSLIAATGLGTLSVSIMIHGMLKDGITSWTPTYMNEVIGVSASLAAFYAIVPQIVNLAAAAFAYKLYNKIKNEILCEEILFGIAIVSLIILMAFGHKNAIITIGCLSSAIMSMQASNVVFVSIIPLRFIKYGRLAAVSGMNNALGYLGCAVSMYIVAGSTEHFGWDFTVFVWIIASLTGLLFCFWTGKRMK